MGSIYKRGEVYWIKYYRAGKPYRESTKSTKEADGRRLLKRREGEISEGKLPEYLKDVATFAYTVGWRLREVCALTWAHVDRTQGVVRLEPGETNNDEGRTVYLDDELKAVFEEQWNRRKRLGSALPWVFLNEDGTDRVKRFYKAWKTACKKAGVGVRLFHDFRRTAIRNLVRAGVPERVAMMVSGHKTRSIFDQTTSSTMPT